MNSVTYYSFSESSYELDQIFELFGVPHIYATQSLAPSIRRMVEGPLQSSPSLSSPLQSGSLFAPRPRNHVLDAILQFWQKEYPGFSVDTKPQIWYPDCEYVSVIEPLEVDITRIEAFGDIDFEWWVEFQAHIRSSHPPTFLRGRNHSTYVRKGFQPDSLFFINEGQVLHILTLLRDGTILVVPISPEDDNGRECELLRGVWSYHRRKFVTREEVYSNIRHSGNIILMYGDQFHSTPQLLLNQIDNSSFVTSLVAGLIAGLLVLLVVQFVKRFTRIFSYIKSRMSRSRGDKSPANPKWHKLDDIIPR